MSQLFQDGESGDVFLATSVYDAPDAAYTFSIARSREALSKAGISSVYCLLSGNCHVDDARNTIVAEFLQTDCKALVFIDADVSWTPDALVRLCQHKADIVGGVYPYRRESPNGEMPVRMKSGPVIPDEQGLVEVEGLPTGFMRISRHVIEHLVGDCESFTKKDRTIPLLFRRTLVMGTRWGGDLHFCNLWRAEGGKIMADYEMVLGHTAKIVLKGSLGSGIRRQQGLTLCHIAAKVRAGTWTMQDLTEAREYVGNHWGAFEDVLALCVRLAGEAKGPILEAGSGLTTILMAAATDQTVFCLEHSKLHAEKLIDMSRQAGVSNIGLCLCPIKDGWYDLSDMDIPRHYGLALNDGPPREFRSRAKFFDHIDAEIVICDDADNADYAKVLQNHADHAGRTLTFVTERAAVICAEPFSRAA